VLGAVQFELCSQAGEQIANGKKKPTFRFQIYRFLLKEYSRVLHILSSQPTLQLQVSGAEQFPLTHAGEHIAINIKI